LNKQEERGGRKTINNRGISNEGEKERISEESQKVLKK